MANSNLMLVSASPDFLLVFKHILETDGFGVVVVGGYATASQQADLIKPAAVIADSADTNSASVELCLSLKGRRETKSVTFIPILEPGADAIYIDLIRAGADRCFLRPFTPVELLEYLRSRFSDRVPPRQQILTGGGIELDVRARCAHRDGASLKLGMLDFNLLQLFMERAGIVLRRDELMVGGWPANTFVDDRTVDVRIGLLRKALGATDAAGPIRTVRGVGYVFDPDRSS
ncbi:response regulator transcription factor [Rhizobium sp. XQZ8]|uniref:winged helix-turn-helix transcriptional regulator n=1 Tax=Rhizobium populisoli TaxID=2859785 RepID=UPI001C66EA84|nr:response regulator transcription factor [Rhizobium populisoli]MBW6425752.1 response regulator transcription factor [Rhizobium populisoli]